MEGQRRTSVRLATTSYSFVTPQVDITDITDAQAVEDLRLSEVLEKNKEVRLFFKERGNDSAFKFYLEELHDTTPISKSEDTELCNNISLLIGACLSDITSLINIAKCVVVREDVRSGSGGVLERSY
jgi:hypothetical protein